MAESIDRQFDVGTGSGLRISNVSGTIQIHGAETASVDIRATKRGTPEEMANTQLLITRDGAEVRVTTEARGKACAVDYDIVVPPDCSVRVRSTSGDVRIEDLCAPVEVDSISGSVEVRGITGGHHLLHTASGHLQARNVDGSLDVRTASGAADIRESRLRGFEIDTATGSVTLETPLFAGAHYAAQTASGSLTLLVPSDTAATVMLRTMSGSIRSDLPCRIEKEGFGSWRAQINGGGAEVTVLSASGDLFLGIADALGGTGSETIVRRAPDVPSADVQPAAAMQGSTTAVLKALERGDLTVDDALARLEQL